MPNTYTQIYIQVVFATKGRDIKIKSEVRKEIEKYICGIFNNKKQKVLAIYANPDHIHIFFSYKNLQITIPQLIKTVKIESTNFINDKKLCFGKFSWQEGYGAFSYAKSQKDKVVNYVLNQEKHHSKKSFKEEYVEMLNAFEIEFRDEYLFEFYDDAKLFYNWENEIAVLRTAPSLQIGFLHRYDSSGISLKNCNIG